VFADKQGCNEIRNYYYLESIFSHPQIWDLLLLNVCNNGKAWISIQRHLKLYNHSYILKISLDDELTFNFMKYLYGSPIKNPVKFFLILDIFY